MKFLYSIVAILLLHQGNAFSAKKQPTGKVPVASSRKDFLQLTSAAAFASLVGSTVAPQVSVAVDIGGKIRYAGEDVMSQKGHGTSAQPVQSELLYGANNKLADKICNFNRYVFVPMNESVRESPKISLYFTKRRHRIRFRAVFGSWRNSVRVSFRLPRPRSTYFSPL